MCENTTDNVTVEAQKECKDIPSHKQIKFEYKLQKFVCAKVVQSVNICAFLI